MSIKVTLKFFLVSVLAGAVAMAEPPPSRISGVTIASDAVSNYLSYAHVKVIGVCVWMEWTMWGPTFETTLELDEFQPDMVISTFDSPGDDPWIEANTVMDPAAHLAGNAAVDGLYGSNLGYGANNASPPQNDQAIHTYVVDVVGDPVDYIHMPWMLRSDTHGYLSYYSSDLDAATDRMGIAEALQFKTYNPFEYYIGPSMFANWGYLYPRVMSINQPNEYEGSVLAALHAGAIVSNGNILHVVHSTNDSCGQNCAVANINADLNNRNEIWQEVYPYNKKITLGDMGVGSLLPVGSADNAAGKGNYVFQVWRHYRGCIQGPGHLVFASVPVPPTQKM